MADLGCGTGILPIVTSTNGGFQGKMYTFDKESNCVEATKMNSQIFGVSERLKPIEIDLVEFY
jgi:ribosomal protein L11 methylase PrmA